MADHYNCGNGKSNCLIFSQAVYNVLCMYITFMTTDAQSTVIRISLLLFTCLDTW